MTLHPHGPEPAAEPPRELENAFCRARAAARSRRADGATQVSLDALVAFCRAAVNRMLQLEAALEQAHDRIVALETAGSTACPHTS
jgi:hypothetical protein